jgi:hypothetical protein
VKTAARFKKSDPARAAARNLLFSTICLKIKNAPQGSSAPEKRRPDEGFVC